MRSRSYQRLALFSPLLALLGCDAPTGPPPPAPGSVARSADPASNPPAAPPTTSSANPSDPSPPRNGAVTYTLRGVVRDVDASKGSVTIAHEAMPGFMGAMVMPFTVADRAILDDVRPNDIVYGPMVVQFERGSIRSYQLTDLTVTGTTTTSPAEGTSPASRFRKVEPLAVGQEVPDFAVTVQDGSTLRLSSLRGRVVALTFIYTRCPLPDFCPAVDSKFADLRRLVAARPERAERIRLLSISFDARHDTPDVLQKHAERRGAKYPWSFAVADPAELARVGPLLGLDYYPDRDEFAHNLATAVIAPDGRLARLELGRSWTPSDLARTIIDLIP